MKACVVLAILIGGVCSIPIDVPKTMDADKEVMKETTMMEMMTTTMMMKPEKTTMWKPTTMKKKSSESDEKDDKDDKDKKDEKDKWMSTTMKMDTKMNTEVKTANTEVKTTNTEVKTETEKKACKTKTMEKGTSMPINDMETVMTVSGQDSPVISLQLDTQPEEPLIVSTVTRMTDEMQREMVSWAREAFRLYKDNEYLVAKHIVTEADAKLGPYWHCAAGESFEAYFTFEKDTFMRMSKGKIHVQCYKHFCSE